MKQFEFTIILHPDADEGGYCVEVPALPGCITQGDTIEEAVANARDAIRLHVQGLLADGEQVPEEKDHPQTIVIGVTV